MQVISLQPVGACLNDARASAALQTAQEGKAAPRQSQLAPSPDAFKNPQVVSTGVLHSYVAAYIAANSLPSLHRTHDSDVPVQYLFSNKCTILHASPQELLHGYSETGVAYLDLSYYPTDALPEPGPAACVAGKLELVPGQFGMPSLVCHSDITLHSLWKLNIMSTTGNL